MNNDNIFKIMVIDDTQNVLFDVCDLGDDTQNDDDDRD